MKFKYSISILLIGLSISIFIFYKKEKTSKTFPKPSTGETIIKDGGEEEGDNQSKREEWFKLMHSAAPGTDWEKLEYQTSMRRHIMRSEVRKNASTRGGEEILADGHLTGEWLERGSINQSGSVFVTEYDSINDMIYLVSAGGTLFKGSRSGNDWEVINQDLRFENNFLKLIDTDNGERMLANIIDQPHYSDDGGISWNLASGVPSENPNGRTQYPIVLENVDNHIYLMSKKSYWDNYIIYKSTDNGETYEAIIFLDDSNDGKYAMVNPHHSNEIYLIDKTTDNSILFYKINQVTNSLELASQNVDFSFGDIRANLIATQYDTITRFIAYDAENIVYQTEDFGTTWDSNGVMPTRPWSVGIYVTPGNPDFLMYGDIECYVSSNAGADWFKVDNWWEYYDDINGKLHADMMAFNEFKTIDGDSFILSSNHGGLNITYDYFDSKDNLGLTGLNVSQYYDVVTDPTDPAYIYAGSQDQGFQRALSFDPTEIATFDQVVSGDYGHIVFSQEGERMWTVYPGGWVTLYNFPQSGNITASWEVNSENETVWIPPLMSSPDPTENAIYMAGGNMNGGSGSYLIKLEYDPNLGEIETSQIDYDFYDFSVEGTISMMRTSPVNSDHWYVSTTNGRFFYSYDGGNTWDQSIQFVPGGHYLYGAAIYPSKLDADVVYFGGSGYSNPAVYKSEDGGQNFTAMNQGLPPTLVFEITANEDESLFYAATEAGPYVYVVEEELWYDMSGMGAPNQTYWSVEYLEESQTVRFGTYGRGIWDFQISEEVVNTNEIVLENSNLQVFPNPTSDQVNLSLVITNSNQIVVEFSDLNGRLISRRKFDNTPGLPFNKTIDVNPFPKGTYLITLRDGSSITSSQIIVQ